MKFKNQAELFRYIWDNRPHVSEISGKPLFNKNHPQHYWQYAHILAKGCYKGYALEERNIMLMLPEEHEKQETYEIFQEKKQELKEAYYRDENIKH